MEDRRICSPVAISLYPPNVTTVPQNKWQCHANDVTDDIAAAEHGAHSVESDRVTDDRKDRGLNSALQEAEASQDHQCEAGA